MCLTARPEWLRIAFAVPMYWIMDVTINILQTPYRALVSDLATKEQQIPMQAVKGHSVESSTSRPANMMGHCCLLDS